MKVFARDWYSEHAVIDVQRDFFCADKWLDFNLQAMQRDGLDHRGKFRDSLLAFYKVSDGIKAGAGLLGLDAAQYTLLKHDPELHQASVLKNFEMVGFSEIPAQGTLTLNVMKYLRARLIKPYYFAKSLETLMPRAEALAYYRGLVDQHTRANGTGTKLDEVSGYLFEKAAPKGPLAAAFNFAECEPGPGRVAAKIKKCKWCEVLKEINDPEYAYSIACHYDFEATKVENPAFVLTRGGTLTQGRPYCDFLFHDTRIDKDPAHLPEDFWAKMG